MNYSAKSKRKTNLLTEMQKLMTNIKIYYLNRSNYILNFKNFKSPKYTK
jgi:hypothetical protein